MKIKTSELTGLPLDWAVAKCAGGSDFLFDGITWGFRLNGDLKVLSKGFAPSMRYVPSTDWAQGGPIIERENISVTPLQNLGECGDELVTEHWVANIWFDPRRHTEMWRQRGSTPLIAAMRCCVASKMGDEVDVPENLV
jgi:hypothetical protein